MALPEYGLRDDFVLTPADITPEVMEMFGRHVQQTEQEHASRRIPRAHQRSRRHSRYQLARRRTIFGASVHGGCVMAGFVRRRQQCRQQKFQPGQSGNPNGATKGLREVAAAAKVHTEEMLEILVEIARNTKTTAAARAHAATYILDRAWGRPNQSVAVTKEELSGLER